MSNVIQLRTLADNQMNQLQPELIQAITVDQLHYQLNFTLAPNNATNFISSATNYATNPTDQPSDQVDFGYQL
jgi:hypothetical protein